MSSTTKTHILIAGAGIGGLTLAQCLRAQNHPFTIFERDESPHARPQGWAIALHTILEDLVNSVPDDMPSIEAVNHLLPFEHLQPQLCFFNPAQFQANGMKFMVESKEKKEVGYGQGRVIRANRDRLRDWLLTNIDVQWGKQTSDFREDADGVTVNFVDGTSARGDILVGADGPRSIVRQTLIPHAQLVNVPECFITGEVTLPREAYEKQMKLSHSSYAVLGDGYFLFVGLKLIAEDSNSAEYYWDLVWHDETRAGAHWIDTATSQDLYNYVLEKTTDLEPAFTEIIHATGPKGMKTPPLILRDLVLEEMPASRLTLLGDAAHPMVPFKGEGGCHAIEDAVKLARVLTRGGTLQEYQDEMLARGSKAVRASRAAGTQQGADKTALRVAWGQQIKPVKAEM